MDQHNSEMESVPILVRVTQNAEEEFGETHEEENSEGFEDHAKFPVPWRRTNFEVDEESLRLKDLQESFEKIQHQVESIMKRPVDTDRGFSVAEVTARLGISAKGGLAFIAEAGIEASIEVKFVSSVHA